MPAMVRWPGKIPADTILNDMMSHEDWVPTLMSAAGRPTVTEELKAGVSINGRDYHNHLDGYDFLPYLTGSEPGAPTVSITGATTGY